MSTDPPAILVRAPINEECTLLIWGKKSGEIQPRQHDHERIRLTAEEAQTLFALLLQHKQLLI